MSDEALKLLFEGLTSLLILGAVLLAARSKWFNDRRHWLTTGIDLAYGATAEYVRKSPTKVDDKVAEALKRLSEYLQANGQKPPTEAEVLQAKMRFDALHAVEKKAETLASPT